MELKVTSFRQPIPMRLRQRSDGWLTMPNRASEPELQPDSEFWNTSPSKQLGRVYDISTRRPCDRPGARLSLLKMGSAIPAARDTATSKIQAVVVAIKDRRHPGIPVDWAKTGEVQSLETLSGQERKAADVLGLV